MESNAVLRRAIEKYGQDHQMVVAIEELSELQKELCKYLRYGLDAQRVENIAEEIADVEIMLEQVKIMLVCHVAVTKKRRAKLQRLKDNMDQAEKPDAGPPSPIFAPEDACTLRNLMVTIIQSIKAEEEIPLSLVAQYNDLARKQIAQRKDYQHHGTKEERKHG